MRHFDAKHTKKIQNQNKIYGPISVCKYTRELIPHFVPILLPFCIISFRYAPKCGNVKIVHVSKCRIRPIVVCAMDGTPLYDGRRENRQRGCRNTGGQLLRVNL